MYTHYYWCIIMYNYLYLFILYEISCITCIIAMYYAMYAMLCTFV